MTGVDGPLRGPKAFKATVREVAARYGVRPEAIPGPRGYGAVWAARDEVCWLLHEQQGWSWPRIGQLLGRHHSATLLAARRHWDRAASALVALAERQQGKDIA